MSGLTPTRRAELAALREVAITALRRYPESEGRLTLIAHDENTICRHDSADGRHLVRVHRPHRHGRGVDSAAAIRFEIVWLRAIRRETWLAVPEAISDAGGATTVAVTAAGRSRVCSVLRWMDGRILENSARPVHLERLGGAMARLHDHADAWQPPPGFTRISWDHEAIFGDVMVYGDRPTAQCWELLPEHLRGRFMAVGDRMADVIAGSADTGLLQVDLHLGNALFNKGAVKLIDFDDCGTGPRLYDLAVALWELRDEPDYPAFRDALLAGYRARRDIDISNLDDFIALRQVTFDIWYTGTAEVNPAFAARLDAVHEWSVLMLDIVEGHSVARPRS